MSLCSENVIRFLAEFNESREEHKNSLTWSSAKSIPPNILSHTVRISKWQGKYKNRVNWLDQNAQYCYIHYSILNMPNYL